MMNTIFALSMVAGVGLTTGTPIIGAPVAEEYPARHGRAGAAVQLSFTKSARLSAHPEIGTFRERRRLLNLSYENY